MSEPRYTVSCDMYGMIVKDEATGYDLGLSQVNDLLNHQCGCKDTIALLQDRVEWLEALVSSWTGIAHSEMNSHAYIIASNIQRDMVDDRMALESLIKEGLPSATNHIEGNGTGADMAEGEGVQEHQPEPRTTKIPVSRGKVGNTEGLHPY